MSDTDAVGAIAKTLETLRRRQRALNMLRWAVHGVLIGGAAGCVAAMAIRLAGQTDLPWLLGVAGVITAAVVAVCAFAGMFFPISDLKLARALDHAGASQDRFASALQLLDDRHTDRVRLVVEDAMSHVRSVPAAAALPVRLPRSARWAPLPFAVLGLLLVVTPQSDLQAAPPPPPEISAEQWQDLAAEFDKELATLPKPLTADEEELQKELEKLAEKLKQNPDKKDALKDIARLSDRVEKERRSISEKELSMKRAAKAIAKSAALKQLAEKMKQGQYQQAAEEMQSLAARMQNGELSPDAEEFEAIAQDLEKLAKELEADQEMGQECENAASAASRMNKEELAKALKRMSEQMKKNAGKYQRSDNLARSKSMLEELKRRMNQQKCEGDQEGQSGFCENPGDKPGKPGKGGLKAGWGSMAKWDGGALNKNDEKRIGEMSDAQETQGSNSSFQIVSPDEKARSARAFAEMYAEFVQMAEADLDLDSVPVSQRDYLRRYFNSIRPQEPASQEDSEDQPAP